MIDLGKKEIAHLHGLQLKKRATEFESDSIELKAALEEDKKKVKRVEMLLENLKTSFKELGICLLALAKS